MYVSDMEEYPQWKIDLAEAYQKYVGCHLSYVEENLTPHPGTKEDWIRVWPADFLLVLPYLPDGWATEEHIRDAALQCYRTAIVHCLDILPTHLLEECIERCNIEYRYRDKIHLSAIAELERRKEQEFLVKTIQAL